MPWKKEKENSVTEFRKEFDNLVDRFFGTGLFPMTEGFFEKNWYPTLDVSEGKKEITVKAEIPGVEAKDIDVSINGRMLTIKGEKKQEKEEKDKNYHRIERSYGCFNRSVELPADVDETSVDASYKKGVLKVTLKKARETEFKKIEIKTS
jgi:HSP20 family protein